MQPFLDVMISYMFHHLCILFHDFLSSSPEPFRLGSCPPVSLKWCLSDTLTANIPVTPGLLSSSYTPDST